MLGARKGGAACFARLYGQLSVQGAAEGNLPCATFVLHFNVAVGAGDHTAAAPYAPLVGLGKVIISEPFGTPCPVQP